jgi:hypothetical protein
MTRSGMMHASGIRFWVRHVRLERAGVCVCVCLSIRNIYPLYNNIIYEQWIAIAPLLVHHIIMPVLNLYIYI